MEAMEEGAVQFTGHRTGASATSGWGVRGRWPLGLGTGFSLTQKGATHLSGRHSTARAGSPSGCHRWSRCCLWWLSRCSDPRHTAGLHSTHCPGCRPAGSGGSTRPGSQTRRAQPVAAQRESLETLRRANHMAPLRSPAGEEGFVEVTGAEVRGQHAGKWPWGRHEPVSLPAWGFAFAGCSVSLWLCHASFSLGP